MDSRISNSKRNIKTGIVKSVVSILLPFVVRSAILYVLGEQYLGLSGLFTAILSVLNMAELGFASAIIYNMYEPIAQNDVVKIRALLMFYKRVYRVIGCVILAIGLGLIPWLPKLIKGSWPAEINIYCLYLIYLANTVLSYMLFAYKSALLSAEQRADLVDKVHIATHVGQYVLELLIIVVLKNFYCYAAVSILLTVANNLSVDFISRKRYPELFCQGKLGQNELGSLKRQIKGLFIIKVSDVARNSLDNIILSAMIGLTSVAVYDNYYMIFNGIYAVMIVINGALQASVGNSVAVCSKEKNYEDMRKIQFIQNWMSSWCAICLLCLYQPLMRLWTKSDSMLLSDFDMVLFCVYFYAICANNCRNLYFSSNGLWLEGALPAVFEAIANIVLNIVLGKLLGVTGILLATILTIVVFNYFARTEILFKGYFERSPRQFFADQGLYFLVVIAVACVSALLCSLIPFEGILGLGLRAVLCLFIPNVLLFICFCKTSRFAVVKFYLLNNVLKR